MTNSASLVSWGNVLNDDVLVWIPHALCRHSHILGLTFDDIGFITQLFSFRGPKGIMPSDSTLALRGGFKTRNPIIDRYKRLEKMGYVKRIITRNEKGQFSSCRYDFSQLRKKLEKLVKLDWKTGERTPRKKTHRVDGHQHGDSQHGDSQHGESQQEKHKDVETQGSLETHKSIETEAEDSFVAENFSNNIPKKFATYRKQLKGDKLQAFELVADNLDKVVGKTLLEFVNQSPESVKSAYQEMVDREKKHFSYFAKVFFSHLRNQQKKGREAVNYDNIDEELYQ